MGQSLSERKYKIMVVAICICYSVSVTYAVWAFITFVCSAVTVGALLDVWPIMAGNGGI